MTNSKKGGAARKAPNGLNVPIYLRGDQVLADGIDRVLKRERAKHPGMRIAKADVVRMMLTEATARSDEEANAGKRKGAK